MTTAKWRAERPPSVPKELLSADDYEAYEALLRRWDRGPSLRELPAFAAVTAIFGAAVMGGLVAGVLWGDSLSPEEELRIVPQVLAVYAAALVPYVWFALRSLRRWRVGLRAEASTILQKRSKLASSRDAAVDDDPVNPYWATGTYQPRRYHAAFDGTSSEHRDYIRDAYGDLDTWESNRPD